jgi:hypothetical protein
MASLLRKRTFTAFLSDPVEDSGSDVLDEANRIEELDGQSLRN